MISIKSIKNRTIFLFFLFLPAMGNAAQPTEVSPTEVAAPLPFWQYSAKFVCGAQREVDTDVVSGIYRTTINVHNSSPKKAIEFRKKAVVAFAERNKHGDNGTAGSVLISLYHLEFLRPDDAMGVDCKDIFELLKSPNSISTEKLPISTGEDADTFFDKHQIEGFLVIQVLGSANNEPLDVIGKYSARPTGSEVSTLDVEQVPGKRVTQ